MKVLVTGGSGFIGSHIVDQLIKENHQVLVVDDLSTGHKKNLNQEAEFSQCSITSEKLLSIFNEFKPEAVIHQAAQVSVAKSIEDPIKDEEINIKGSINVIQCAVNSGVRKIVFASSAAVYGNPEYLPVNLDHPVKPLAPYGLSKYTVENYLDMMSNLYGFSYTVLRYGNVYGPRQDANGEGGVIAIFAEALSKEEVPFIYGDGEQTRDFVYVEDVASANIKALSNGDNKIYNVSSNQKVSINELFFLMKEISGQSYDPIYKEERNGDIRESVLENKETLRDLSWSQTVALPEGLKKTLQFYKI